DAQGVENGIEASLSTSSVKVTQATCPSDVPVEPGGTFTCNVTLSNGGTGEVTVTQRGANNYTYAFTPRSVHSRQRSGGSHRKGTCRSGRAQYQGDLPREHHRQGWHYRHLRPQQRPGRCRGHRDFHIQRSQWHRRSRLGQDYIEVSG